MQAGDRLPSLPGLRSPLLQNGMTERAPGKGRPCRCAKHLGRGTEEAPGLTQVSSTQSLRRVCGSVVQGGQQGQQGREGGEATHCPSPGLIRGRLWSVAYTSEFILPPGKGAGTSTQSVVT